MQLLGKIGLWDNSVKMFSLLVIQIFLNTYFQQQFNEGSLGKTF